MSWERNLKNKYLLRRDDDYLLGIIYFDPEHEAWTIELIERFDKTFLSREVRVDDLDRAKKFTTMILAAKDLRGESWMKVKEMTYYLRGWISGERELLAMINFDTEEKRWLIEVLRREYKKTLDKKINLDQLDEVRKLTESLAAAAPYQYEVILSNFDRKQNEMQMKEI